MDENNYVNPSQTSPPPPPAAPEPPVTWRDRAAPFVALALAILFWQTFAFRYMHSYGPGLGILVFTAAYFAAVFLMLGLRRDAGGLFYMAVALCLALCTTLYCHPGFMILNCFIILYTAAAATFRLSGQDTAPVLSLASVGETIKLSLFALFSRIPQPWKRLRGRRDTDRDKAARIAVAVLLCVALLAVVLALLASADMVFGSFFTGLADRLRELSLGGTVWRIIRTCALAVFILSGLYFIRTEPPEARPERPARERQVLPFLLSAVVLDAVYVLFCAIQLRFLFGGAEAASMAGGWAEYARTGFFQLVAVAAINLTLCVIGADEARFGLKGGRALRIAEAVMLALTVVILVSAARRMQLYILAYGMSSLRLVTLWGMAAILVGILAAGFKLYQPAFAFFPVFFGFVLTTWCVLCLMNPAGRVARYNVDAYLDGRLSAVDVHYLGELTSDAAGALRLLDERTDEYDADIREVEREWSLNGADRWTLWKTNRYPDNNIHKR